MIILSRLDTLRARLLKASFVLPGAETVFRSRPLRLFAQFAGAFALASLFALHLPLVPLIAAPLIAGPMHLLVSAQVTRARMWPLLAALCAILAYLTTTALAITIVVAFAVIATQATSIKRASLLMVGGGAFAYFAWTSLYLAAALAGFVHNFVGFAFWYRACRTRGERSACLAGYSVLVAMTLAILHGAFDGATVFWTENLPYDLADAFSFLGEPQRVLSAFALGQSVHYFVWLKAIPDQTSRSPIPPAFRSRYLAFERTVGRPMIVAIVLATTLLFTFALVNLGEARRMYAAGAAIHGWLELAALGI